ncbi:hypothetical protein PED39_07015 [Methanomassiliicoccales archaeon LGM-RCC1]|nr:hypothetical protein PED39_07015 [Methanomassiliicoccales archaeon LGM-RCC1]
MTRYCPNCGEAVPSNCLTCPKCYAKIPAEPVKNERRQEEQRTGSNGKNQSIRRILAIVPGFFGILGLGHIYMDYKQPRGYKFLIVGLVFFSIGTFLVTVPSDWLGFILKMPVGIGFILLYLITFVISVLDSASGFHVKIRHM